MDKSIIYLNLIIPLLIKIFIPDGRYGVITVLVDMFVLPLILILLNIFIFVYRIELSFARLWILMLVGMFMGIITGYLIWGISNSRLLHPDSETLLVNGMLLVYYGIISSVFFVILRVIQFIVTRK